MKGSQVFEKLFNPLNERFKRCPIPVAKTMPNKIVREKRDDYGISSFFLEECSRLPSACGGMLANWKKFANSILPARGEQESVPVVVMRHQPETVIQGSANAGIQAVLTAERSSRLSQREEKIESL
jgi:hypothetical protein